jgi:hypothetical protein
MEIRIHLLRRAVALLVLGAVGLVGLPAVSAPEHSPPAAALAPRPSDDDPAAAAFRAHRSGISLLVEGRVKRILADDRSGSKHQRFIFETNSGLTLLVAYNIDLAPRLTGLKPGEPLSIRGEYVWNPQGGLMHWTHHDPSGRHSPGYIEWNGHRYD